MLEGRLWVGSPSGAASYPLEVPLLRAFVLRYKKESWILCMCKEITVSQISEASYSVNVKIIVISFYQSSNCVRQKHINRYIFCKATTAVVG